MSVPELTVSLPLWIASQVVGLVALVVAMWAMQLKRKRGMILLVGVACALEAIQFALLANWVVFGIQCIAVFRSFIFAYFEKRREQGNEVKQWIPLACVVLFISVAIISVSFTWVWWVDWLLCCAFCFNIICIWARSTHLLRFAFSFYDALNIAKCVMFFDIIGIVYSALCICSVVFFYVRLLVSRRGERGVPRPRLCRRLRRHSGGHIS